MSLPSTNISNKRLSREWHTTNIGEWVGVDDAECIWWPLEVLMIRISYEARVSTGRAECSAGVSWETAVWVVET